MLKKKLLLISIITLFFLPSFASAIDVPGWPIVPCGLSQDRPETPNINESKSCGRCDLFQLLKNITDFIIGGVMPPLAVLLFVWAGFLILLGGANPGLYAQGQKVFSTTFFGLMIMLGAWLITNTLILSVGARYNNAQNWWQFTCVETTPVNPPPVSSPGLPSLCSDYQQLAQQNNVPLPANFPQTPGVNSPELNALISCVTSRIGSLIDQSQIFTYERTNPLCNLTRGRGICGPCAHSEFSCHYGGRDSTQGSMAVDFNAANGNETALYNELLGLQSVCGFGFIL